MSDPLVRLLIVAVLVGVALGVGFLLRRWQWASHPPIDTDELDLPAGVVVFTSTECGSCKGVLAKVRGLDVPVRQVTHELEPAMFEEAGVEAVPLTVVIDDAGSVVAQLPGDVSAWRIKRAVRRAG